VCGEVEKETVFAGRDDYPSWEKYLTERLEGFKTRKASELQRINDLGGIFKFIRRIYSMRIDVKPMIVEKVIVNCKGLERQLVWSQQMENYVIFKQKVTEMFDCPDGEIFSKDLYIGCSEELEFAVLKSKDKVLRLTFIENDDVQEEGSEVNAEQDEVEREPWKEEEIQLLKDGITEYSWGKWAKISLVKKVRTPSRCGKYARRYLSHMKEANSTRKRRHLETNISAQESAKKEAKLEEQIPVINPAQAVPAAPAAPAAEVHEDAQEDNDQQEGDTDEEE
jgi:hypothetical protein